MAYVIGAGRLDVKDGTCLDNSPGDRLSEGHRTVRIHPDEYIDHPLVAAVPPRAGKS